MWILSGLPSATGKPPVRVGLCHATEHTLLCPE